MAPSYAIYQILTRAQILLLGNLVAVSGYTICQPTFDLFNPHPVPRRCEDDNAFIEYYCCPLQLDICCKRVRMWLILFLIVIPLVLTLFLICCLIACISSRQRRPKQRNNLRQNQNSCTIDSCSSSSSSTVDTESHTTINH